MLYAVGVGAGQQDAAEELALTTENSVGVEQTVLPTFVVTLTTGNLGLLGDVDLAQVVHAEQAVQMRRCLPANGTARVTTEVTALYDKAPHAIAVLGSEVRDAATDEAYASVHMSVLVRGAGGWGGERGHAADWTAPERPADHVVPFTTSPGQALVYRLSGDRNPLHSDPQAAGRSGFPAPILHGLCTYGFTARALLRTVCAGDAKQFGSMSARFSRPVIPGQSLEVSIWLQEAGAAFRTAVAESGIVLDHGRFERANRMDGAPRR